MGRMNIIIDDFSMGEVSPLSEAKLSSDTFQDGLLELTNMAPDAHGPLMGRPGFEYVGTIEGDENVKNISLFEITISQNTYYVVALLHERLLVWDDAGNIILDEAKAWTGVQLHGEDGNEHLTHATPEPGAYVLTFVNVNLPPFRITFDPETDTATYELITFTAAPWTDEDDYPRSMTYFQGRSWWVRGRLIWSSKSNNYYDMTSGSAADDAIVFQVARYGDIKWVEGNRNLLFGSDKHEFIATAESGVLQPGDMRVDIQSSYGSSAIQPVQIGNEVIFVTDDYRSLRSMWYRLLESGGWTSGDLTFIAEHITRELVTDISFARNPYSIVFSTLRDGDMVCCGYFRQENGQPMVGWYRMQNDLMAFKSLAAPERVGRSELWTVAENREVAGEFFVMKKDMREYNDPTEVFLDCFTTKDYTAGPTKFPFFGDVDFFSDTVDVIADGFHYPAMTVQDNGTIELPNEHMIISAGHPYEQRITTMPMLIRSDDNVGHQKKRWNKVFLRTLRSYRPLVNGQRPPERHVETNDDVAEPFVDGFILVTPAHTWDRSGTLIIVQDLPFRLLLTGIYGEFSAEQI